MTATATLPSLTRLPEWPERLAEYLEQHRGALFGWDGERDCAHFAAGAVRAVTSQDVLPCGWSSREEAVRLLRNAGGLVAAVDAVLPRLQSPTFAQRADIVLMQEPAGNPARRWLAVCDGSRAWAPSRSGLLAASMTAAVHAWGVGHG